MPRPRQVCGSPGCPNVKPCEDHPTKLFGQPRQRGGHRGDPFYGTKRWRRISKMFLASHPRCEECGAPAKHADHEPERRVLLAQGESNPDQDKYLHPLCWKHHSSKTLRQTNERRGEARRRRGSGGVAETPGARR